jgi:FIST N domain
VGSDRGGSRRCGRTRPVAPGPQPIDRARRARPPRRQQHHHHRRPVRRHSRRRGLSPNNISAPASRNGVAPPRQRTSCGETIRSGRSCTLWRPSQALGGRYVSALSEHRDSVQAAADVTAEVLDRLGPVPELAVLFVTPPHRGAVDEIAEWSVRCCGPSRCWVPRRWLCSARGVKSKRRLGSRCSLPGCVRLWSPSVWARRRRALSGRSVGSRLISLAPDRCCWSPIRSRSRRRVVGRASEGPVGPGGGGRHRVGGQRARRQPAAGGRRVLQRRGRRALLTEDVAPQPMVSEGCRPIGRPYIATRADGHVIYELAGKPAVERLRATLEHLQPAERQLAEQGLQCGVVIDKQRSSSSAAISSSVACSASTARRAQSRWATPCRWVRPSSSGVGCDERRRGPPRRTRRSRRRWRARVFTCNGRGRRLFGTPDHDATVIADLLGTPAVAGMFCAGELGPVGSRSAVHGFTASIAIFT